MTLFLCFEILEIIVHELYQETTGETLLEQNPFIGLAKAFNKLKESDYHVPEEIDSTINFINKYRNAHVHKKYIIPTPTILQSEAILLLVKELIIDLFDQT